MQKDMYLTGFTVFIFLFPVFRSTQGIDYSPCNAHYDLLPPADAVDTTPAGGASWVGRVTDSGEGWAGEAEGEERVYPCSRQGVLRILPPDWARTTVISLGVMNPRDRAFLLGGENSIGNGRIAKDGNVMETAPYPSVGMNGTTIRVHSGQGDEFLNVEFDQVNMVELVASERHISITVNGVTEYQGCHTNFYTAGQPVYLGVNRIINSDSDGNPDVADAQDLKVGAGVCDICVSYCEHPINVNVGPEGQCEDVDECQTITEECGDFCVNTFGGHNCGCTDPRMSVDGNRACVDCQRNYNAGGTGGLDFNDIDDITASITQISIYSSALGINGIQVQYGENSTNIHGMSGNKDEVVLNNGEYIVGVDGTWGTAAGKPLGIVKSLQFTTNTGRMFGPYGKEGQNDFTFDNYGEPLLWISGRASHVLDMLIFHFGCTVTDTAGME